MIINDALGLVLVCLRQLSQLCSEASEADVFNFVRLPRVLSSQLPFRGASRIDPHHSSRVMCLKTEAVPHILCVSRIQRSRNGSINP